MELKFGDHRTRSLQAEWDHYGADSFLFEVLAELEVKPGEEIDIQQELTILQEMVLEDLNLTQEQQYL